MNRKSMDRILKISFVLILLLSLALTAGCGVKIETPLSGQEQGQAEDQSQNQPDEAQQASIGLISFQTQDIYGNDINQDIFRDYPLTLVNVWGTFCGPCLDEMPFLGELHDEYAAKGVNIVGIVVDLQDEDLQVIEDQRELAKQITETTGADYTHLIMTDDMIDAVLNQFDAIPSSFFVDSDGNIVSEFYIGSRSKEEWVDIIETTMENQL